MTPTSTRSPTWPPWKENRRLARVLALVLAVFVAGGVALGLREGPDRVALVRLAAIAAWFVAIMIALRRAPRARAAREDGVPVLRAAAVRRLSLALVLLPLVALVAYRTALEGGNATAVALLGLAAIGALAVLGGRADRRFALLPAGVELRVRRGRALLPWERIREVRVEVYRRHAGIVLLGEDGHPSLGVSAWLDGVPELARALLDRAPPRALDPEARVRLEALAAG